MGALFKQKIADVRHWSGTHSEPVCPPKAIYSDDDLPDDMSHFAELNTELAKVWPRITEQKRPLPDADKWDGVENKLQHLAR